MSKRAGLIVGILLVALGVWAATGKASYTTKRAVVAVGDFKASVREEHSVPRWVGYAAIAGGVLVLLATGRRRT